MFLNSQLPTDLILSIFDFLLESIDLSTQAEPDVIKALVARDDAFSTLRQVCRSWRNAAQHYSRLIPPTSTITAKEGGVVGQLTVFRQVGRLRLRIKPDDTSDYDVVANELDSRGILRFLLVEIQSTQGASVSNNAKMEFTIPNVSGTLYPDSPTTQNGRIIIPKNFALTPRVVLERVLALFPRSTALAVMPVADTTHHGNTREGARLGEGVLKILEEHGRGLRSLHVDSRLRIRFGPPEWKKLFGACPVLTNVSAPSHIDQLRKSMSVDTRHEHIQVVSVFTETMKVPAVRYKNVPVPFMGVLSRKGNFPALQEIQILITDLRVLEHLPNRTLTVEKMILDWEGLCKQEGVQLTRRLVLNQDETYGD